MYKLITFAIITTIGITYGCRPKSKSKFTTKIDTSLSISKYIQDHKLLLKKDTNASKVLYQIAGYYAIMALKDSAFYYLNKATRKDTNHLLFDYGEFYPLMKDSRWLALERKSFDKVLCKYNPTDTNMIKTLWRAIIIDQCYYTEIFFYEKKYPAGHKIHDSIWQLRKKTILAHTKIILKFIDENGWPIISRFSKSGSKAAYLTIQHSNDSIIKKYLPIIEKACKINEADWDDYAHMKDRSLLFSGKKQYYGTHYEWYDESTNTYYLKPIEDITNLNLRRSAIGLMPLIQYYDSAQIVFSETAARN